MAEDPEAQGESRGVSDLVGVELTLALMAWLLLMLACFFFVGAVAGMIVVAAGVIGFGWFLASAVRRAEIRD